VLGNDLNMVVALAVLVPELGQISGAQAAALLGVMPYSDDSGQRHGKRQISGGREDACRALSMATLTAACRRAGQLLCPADRGGKAAQGGPDRLHV
jgi:transposase